MEKYDDHSGEYLNEADISGCDGIIVEGELSTLYVVFDSEQIKSATDMLFCVNDNKMVEILTINIIVSTKGEYVFNDSKNKVSKKLILCKKFKIRNMLSSTAIRYIDNEQHKC